MNAMLIDPNVVAADIAYRYERDRVGHIPDNHRSWLKRRLDDLLDRLQGHGRRAPAQRPSGVRRA